MTCRVCGGLSPPDMPCYNCVTLLIEIHGKYTQPAIRERAASELYEIKKKNEEEGS